MIHSFLLIGQSNAAGRGFFAEAEALDTCGDRLKVMRNGHWLTMFRPVNPDRPFSGTCLAESFAKAYAMAHPEVEVGIIPCADGGTPIDKWQPGEILFDNALHCARMAMRTTKLCGILWHQGEADCSEERSRGYYEKFVKLMDSLRAELGLPELPVIVGGLGDFLADLNSPTVPHFFKKINGILEDIGRSYPHCAFASAQGLMGNPDNLHFSAAALQEFGMRYYREYEKTVVADTADDSPLSFANTERSALELL